MTMDISDLVSFRIDVEKINIEEVMKQRYKILKARKLTYEKIALEDWDDKEMWDAFKKNQANSILQIEL
jgi:hypothetical protein